MTAKLTNKPVTPTREMLELLKDWQAPDVTASKQASVVGKTNFLGVPIEELYKAKPTLIEREEEEEIHQLTAEEVEAIRQQAYDEGFAAGKEAGFEVGKVEGLEAGKIEGLELGQKEGFEAGIEEGRETGAQQIKRWQELADKLYEPNERIDKTIEQQLLNLAVMLAESVIRVEVQSNKESLLEILRESVSALPFNTEFCELHLHPDDIELLQESITEEEMAENKWIFKPETHFQHGDIIVATPNSLIDRSVKQRIKQSIERFIEDAGLENELAEKPKISTASDLQTDVANTSDNGPELEPESASDAAQDVASDAVTHLDNEDAP